MNVEILRRRAEIVRVLRAFLKFILTPDADVRHTVCHALRNVVIAQIEHLDGEVAALYQ